MSLRRHKSDVEPNHVGSPSSLTPFGGPSLGSSPGLAPAVKRSLSLQHVPTDSRALVDAPATIIRAELQINVPVEGVELEPYVLIQTPTGQSRQVTDDDEGLIFKWARCEYTASNDATDGPKLCILTGKPATMQCLLPDVTFEINGHEYGHEQAYFAGADEFLRAWPCHVRTNHSRHSDNPSAAAPPLPRPRRQDPSRDFISVWQEIGDKRVYVPQRQDVGRILKLECTPVSYSGILGKTVSVESAEVLPAQHHAPVRGMMDVPCPNNFDQRLPRVAFKVLSYNCLADIYATPQAYPYTQPWALAWNYRKRNVVREILSYKADILALQEIQADHYKDFIEPELRKAGYEGVYKQKTRESMGQDGKMDGCAILYRRSRYSLVEKHALEFNNVAMSRKGQFKSDKALPCLLKDNIALVLVLELVGSGGGGGQGHGARVCVATTHIYQNQGFPHVKMWQVMTLVRELEKFTSSGQRYPLVLTGDLNSLHDSAVYDFLNRGCVSPSHVELLEDSQGILDAADLRHSLQLRDAHAALGGDVCTNYTAAFSGVLDYIWYTAERLRVTRVLDQIDCKTLEAHTALPSPQYSSDHIALMAEFEMLLR